MTALRHLIEARDALIEAAYQAAWTVPGAVDLITAVDAVELDITDDKETPMGRATTITRTIEMNAEIVERDGVKLVVASADTVDRYGDIVDQDTLRLDRYMKNPVLLYMHSHHDVIGRADPETVGVRDLDSGARALMFAPVFDDGEHNPTGRRVKAQWELGYIRGVSIGFLPNWSKAKARNTLPKEHRRYGESGFVFESAELLEISIVSVPANAEAVAASAPEVDQSPGMLRIDPAELARLVAAALTDDEVSRALRAQQAPPSPQPLTAEEREWGALARLVAGRRQ